MMLTPAIRALSQLDDRVFVGVLWRSVAWAALGFVLLAVGIGWGVHRLLLDHELWAWLAALLSGIGTAVLAVFLFLPVAALVATLFIDRVAASVERRWYPGLPIARPAAMSAQIWDGIALGLRVLLLQLVALLLAFLLPGIGLLLGWGVAAWAIGRGLFVAVAMRRMDRGAATALYFQRRAAVLTQGGLVSALSLVPLANLLSPVLGTAAMVHVLHADPALSGGPRVVSPAVPVIGQASSSIPE